MSLYSGGGKRLAGRQGSSRRGGKRLARRGGRRVKSRRISGIPVLLSAVVLAAGIWYWAGTHETPGSRNEDADSPTAIPLSGIAAQPSEPGPSAPDQEDNRFLLSFAGDCTLGVEHASWGNSGTFPAVVGTDYAYPFSGVQELFGSDDFTFVNLECALTDYNVPAEKEYRFRGLPAYAEILRLGSVEAVTLANNHSLDYGQTGLADTRRNLEALGIAAGADKETFLYTTQRGLRIGVYTAYHIGKAEIQKAIASLRDQGAQVVIAAFHMGTEGSYTPTNWQREVCRYAADCGADIVYNSHPHVLQPVEQRGESLIFYSMGNFCFGGNRNPSDKDTAVIQVAVEVDENGAARLDGMTVYPCRVSSRSDRNDYCPTLYASDSAEAQRVAGKLDGTYQPPAKAPQASGQTGEAIPVSQQLSAAQKGASSRTD